MGRAPAPPNDYRKNRYVSFVPNDADTPVSFRVDKTPSPTGWGWVGLPDGNGLANVVTAMPAPRVWSEPVVHVADCDVHPVADYEIRTTGDGVTFSAPLMVRTIVQPSPKF